MSLGRSIPISDFAIVYDTERNMVVDCGNYGQMAMLADEYNRQYQSRAYQVRPWVFQN